MFLLLILKKTGMGNTYCAGAREKMEDTSKATMEMYAKVSEKMKRKLSKAKKATQEGFTSTKLKVKGYSLNYFDDNGETKVITDFENRLPLRLVPLEAFDRPLAQLLNATGSKNATLNAIIDAYSGQENPNNILKELRNEGTLMRKLLLHSILRHTSANNNEAPPIEEGGSQEIHIPYLRLLGLLICASTKKMKAEIFYELV